MTIVCWLFVAIKLLLLLTFELCAVNGSNLEIWSLSH